jgi:hypothetical protein
VVGPWISSISFLHIYLLMNMVGLVPRFPHFIISPYILMDEYGWVGPWISLIYPFSMPTYGWL